jgi:hypothetical protein
MFKKLAVGLAGAAALLAISSSAFAYTGINISHTGTSISNEISSLSDTGNNSISGFRVRGGSITTGMAQSGINLSNSANFTQLGSVAGLFNEDEGGGIHITTTGTSLSNALASSATSGNNTMHGFRLSGGTIGSGDSMSALSVLNDVNTTIIGDLTE